MPAGACPSAPRAAASPIPMCGSTRANAIIMVRNTAEGLARADAAGADGYRARAGRYEASLRALDARLRRRIAPVPPRDRLIVTDHDAFGYFARRYRIRVAGAVIASLSSAAEPGARALTRLAATIRREGV